VPSYSCNDETQAYMSEQPHENDNLRPFIQFAQALLKMYLRQSDLLDPAANVTALSRSACHSHAEGGGQMDSVSEGDKWSFRNGVDCRIRRKYNLKSWE
jgi:hypothetical protein